MVVTKIVKATNDIHTCGQGISLLSQIAGAPGEPGKSLAKSRIDPFDVGRVDHTAILDNLQQSSDHFSGCLERSGDQLSTHWLSAV